MKKEIVAKFNKNLTKIEFYEITDNYKEYTIIRKQGTNEYYAYDNQNGMVSDNLHIISAPTDKTKYKDIIKNSRMWFYGAIFFWADSKFVTEYGLPNYDKLVSIYKELINVRVSETEILKTLDEVRRKESFFRYLKCRAMSYRFIRIQRKTINRLVKEFKLIW